jgi:antibiotic biosynthesis monooxygenase (ABM) superfamily enzyme
MKTSHVEARAAATTQVPRIQQTLMIWLGVFPTLTLLDLVLGDLLGPLPSLVRTLVLTGLTVPIVVYLLLPRIQQARTALVRTP